MGFFDALPRERKIASIAARRAGLLDHLFGLFVQLGINPDTVNFNELDLSKDDCVVPQGHREEVQTILDSLAKIATVEQGLGL